MPLQLLLIVVINSKSYSQTKYEVHTSNNINTW